LVLLTTIFVINVAVRVVTRDRTARVI